MRRAFEAMEQGMREFVDQRDFPALVIECSDHDVLFPVKVLQNWDRQWNAHLFVTFPFPCRQAQDYVQQCVETVRLQVEALSAALEEADEPAWPPLPLDCLDPRQPPPRRLLTLIRYLRYCAPPEMTLVWALLPSEIADPAGYRALIAPLLALKGYEPWMETHRFLIREDRHKPLFLPELRKEKFDGLLILPIDFSPERVADTLVRTLNDETAPMADRMQAVSQVAALDVAYRRYEAAVDKYNLLIGYSRQQGDAVGEALALGGKGDIARHLGEIQHAKTWYQRALGVAGPTRNLAVMLNLLIGAGECSLALNQYLDAEGYFRLALTAAESLSSPYARIAVLDQLGQTLLANGKPREAASAWHDAKDLSLELSCPELGIPILDRLSELYRRANMPREVEAFAQQKRQLQSA
ncbi:MAG: hypothetical protein FIA97_19450 [Methylococcaceae bacterium]|nr:hypothetical protein [Methylococcaceae bacterium]